MVTAEDTFKCDHCNEASQTHEGTGAETITLETEVSGTDEIEVTRTLFACFEDEREVGEDDQHGQLTVPMVELEDSSHILESNGDEDNQSIATGSEIEVEDEEFIYWECDYNAFISIQSDNEAGPIYNEDEEAHEDEDLDIPVKRHTHAHPLIRLNERKELVDSLTTPLHDRVAQLETNMSQGFQDLSRQLGFIMESLGARY